jgi:hypothetical protein
VDDVVGETHVWSNPNTKSMTLGGECILVQ